MDIASVVGLLLAVGLIIGSILTGTAPFSAYMDVPSVLVVIGGATGAGLLCFPLKNIIGLPMVMKKVFLNKSENISALIEQLVSLAETARRDGLLALESRLAEVDSQFIRLGIQMAVDGTRPEVIEDIMRTEMDAIATRHRDGKSIFDQMGRFAPAYGMIGTLMGLIMMLSDMSDPSGIGAGMATALITTLYGAIAANVFFIPFAEKLGFINKQEVLSLEIIVRGIMAIQSGENPRVIEQKLNTFLPPKLRPSEEAA
jgi:chemotaxis protein MotA